MIVNRIYKFEDFDESIYNICEKIEISIPEKIPSVNRSSLFNIDYNEYYDLELINLVSNIYAEDLKLFNYEFPG